MIFISKNIQLKAINIEDQPQLIKLIETIYPPVYKHLWINEDCSFYLEKFYSLENLELELAESDARYFFVVYNGTTTGVFRFIYNKTFQDFPDKKATYLNRIYLGEGAQGKGVAHQLFTWLETKVMQNHNTLIWLKAMDSQQQALRFYEKENFNYGKPTHLDFQLIHPRLRRMQTMYKSLT